MTIELDDKSYIVGMWFSSCPKTENNWLACFIKDPENKKRFKGWSRFRYSKGNEVFNGEDEKNWTTIYSDENKTEKDILELMKSAQEKIEEGYPDKDQIIVQGDLRKLMKLSESKPWMHMRTEKIDK